MRRRRRRGGACRTEPVTERRCPTKRERERERDARRRASCHGCSRTLVDAAHSSVHGASRTRGVSRADVDKQEGTVMMRESDSRATEKMHRRNRPLRREAAPND